jgi:predicted kinase
MEAVVLCGLQGSGKSTLYRDRFQHTHVHVSLDVVGSRAREAELLRACLDEGRSFAVDNTNPTPTDRRRYVEPARAAGFKLIGYLVEADAGEAFARAGIPPARVAATARALQPPTPEEGFDELWHATAAAGGGWRIEPLLTTPPLF